MLFDAESRILIAHEHAELLRASAASSAPRARVRRRWSRTWQRAALRRLHLPPRLTSARA